MSSSRNNHRAPLAEMLGYDRELLRKLPAHLRTNLDSLSQTWLVSCVVMAFPMGVAVWLVEHSLALAALVSAGTAILVLNLLRLIHSGSGTAPELTLKKDFRPSLTPMTLLFGLALLMSQPAQLVHATDSARAQIQTHRDALLASHFEALEGTKGSSADIFTREIAECEFVVLRLKLLWEDPFRALCWTLLYVGLAIFPALLGRTTWLRATRSYERLRYQTQRARLLQLNARADQKVQAALEHYATFRPPWPFPAEPPLLEATVASEGPRE